MNRTTAPRRPLEARASVAPSTVTKVSAEALRPARRRSGRRTSTPTVTTRNAAAPGAWAAALAIVGDPSRLEALSDGSVRIRNHPRGTR